MSRLKYQCPYCKVYLRRATAAKLSAHMNSWRHRHAYIAYWCRELGLDEKDIPR